MSGTSWPWPSSSVVCEVAEAPPASPTAREIFSFSERSMVWIRVKTPAAAW